MIGNIGNKIISTTKKIARKATSFTSEAPKLKQPLIVDIFIKSDEGSHDKASKIFDFVRRGCQFTVSRAYSPLYTNRLCTVCKIEIWRTV